MNRSGRWRARASGLTARRSALKSVALVRMHRLNFNRGARKADLSIRAYASVLRAASAINAQFAGGASYGSRTTGFTGSDRSAPPPGQRQQPCSGQH